MTVQQDEQAEHQEEQQAPAQVEDQKEETPAAEAEAGEEKHVATSHVDPVEQQKYLAATAAVKSGHVIVGILYFVSLALLVTPLADSRSFFLLDVGSLPEITGTNQTVISEIFGPRYGFGIFQDTNGWKWIDENSFVHYFGCTHHEHRFNTLKGFTFCAVGFAGFGVLTALAGAATGVGATGFASLAVGVIHFLMTIIAMAIGWALWAQNYKCDGFSITLGNHSAINYGPVFLTIAFFFSLIILALIPVLGLLSAPAKPTPNEPISDEKGEY